MDLQFSESNATTSTQPKQTFSHIDVQIQFTSEKLKRKGSIQLVQNLYKHISQFNTAVDNRIQMC